MRRVRRHRSTASNRTTCVVVLSVVCVMGCRGISTTKSHAQPQPSHTTESATQPQPARTAVIRRRTPIVQGRSEVGPFVRAGCKDLDPYLDCAVAEQITSLGCPGLWLEPELAALGRRIPIAKCVDGFVRGRPWSIPAPGVREFGCREPDRIHYVVFRDGKFARLSTPEDLRAAFVPIGTPEEAAGLVVALTGATADYKPSKDYLVQVDEIDEAFAEPTREGFKVHLFETHSCGCGPHPRYEVDFLVSRTGAVSVGTKRVVDEIPEGRICID